MGDGGPGHLVWVVEGQVTRCGWWRARSLSVRERERRGSGTARPQEKEHTATEMGGLRKEGCEKGRGG